MKPHIVQVALPTHQKMAIFDYCADAQLPVGSLVKVSLRKKELIGVVWSHERSNVTPSKLKKITEVVATLTQAQVKFLEFIAKYNVADIGAVLKLAIPFNKIVTHTPTCHPGESRDPDLDSTQQERMDPSESWGDKGIYKYTFNLPTLSQSQTAASNIILNSLDKYCVTLLEGVTGSGKTEVYVHAIAKALELGQVLVLLPEIMLSQQFVERFTAYFGKVPDVWHSGVSQKQKKILWKRVLSGDAKLVVGARSALFLPFKNLKLIVIDEEHDLSYKQEEGVVYNARDMAVAYSHFNNTPIILCSATPSIETLHNVFLQKYQRVNLPTRYLEASMPLITIVDMRNVKLKSGTWLSPILRNKVTAALAAGQQVMLFLNRKGYAPIMICKSCGYKEKCGSCDSFLVTYKSTNLLMCHHCEFTKEVSTVCIGCGAAEAFVNCGPGVERIEEEVMKLWPEARRLVVTKKSVKPGMMRDIYEQIVLKKVDIIIGTQIISKGYHFPHLNLVGVVDADIGLIGADLRSSEKTYQLLSQVSGRAGRENKGEVVIQTYFPDNDIIKALKHNDRKNFYHSEMLVRKLVHMPPFKKLAAIILSGTNKEQTQKVAHDIARAAPHTIDVLVLGPVTAPLSKLRGRHRYRFLIRSAPRINVQKYIKTWLETVKIPPSIRLKVDVDPYSFL